MGKTRDDIIGWLHRLDAYTNAEFGSARTLSSIGDVCVACGSDTLDPDPTGLCRRCSAKRVPDASEIRLFRTPARTPRQAT